MFAVLLNSDSLFIDVSLRFPSLVPTVSCVIFHVDSLVFSVECGRRI